MIEAPPAVETAAHPQPSTAHPVRFRVSAAVDGFLRYYPFGVAGTILFVISVYLFGRSVVSKNSYGLVISVAALFVLAILALLGRWQAERLARSEASWDFSPALYARTSGPSPRAAIDGPAPFFFFRLHTTLRGRLVAGRKTNLSFFRDITSEDPRRIEIPLRFPLCGRLEFFTGFHIGDVFGLTQSRFGRKELFALPIQPAPFPGSQVPPIQAAGGDRETSRTKQPDEERYYQREYVPGDRFRDINWKASSRLTQLFTRTSPVTQEQTQLLSVYFRHFVPVERLKERESLELIAHLNTLKSWLIAYLFRIKREHPEFHFRVATGRGEVILETEEDIHGFSATISDLPMDQEPALPEQQVDESGNPASANREKDSTIFSTSYDENLSAFIQSRPRGHVTVYRTVFDVRELSGLERLFAPRREQAPKPADPARITFDVLGKEMFSTLGSLFPSSFTPARSRIRKIPAVWHGPDIDIVERTVAVQV